MFGNLAWAGELAAILLLLAAIALVVRFLPATELQHSREFRARRVLNWLPVGLTYAFLYMARYNLNVCKSALGAAMTKQDFATIFSWGALVYGVAFVVNGPLTDKLGGRKTILLAAIGAALANIAMGFALVLSPSHVVAWLAVLYAANMYFQSFGAVSIVKVNSAWFHVRERGTFGGIFGILISLGIYFAYDGGRFVVNHAPVEWVFFVPAIILIGFAIADAILVRNQPSEAGFANFDLGDATSSDDSQTLLEASQAMPGRVVDVARGMIKNPVIMTIAAIEFFSGYLRNAIMQWYPLFAKETGIDNEFVSQHWGLLLCVAGILGGMFAGIVSDWVFDSRRGPVAAVLYGAMSVGCLLMFEALGTPAPIVLGALVVVMSLAIIGVHGMLSGTASMDFGGRKNAGVAVGIIDGFVYLGTSAEAVVLGAVLPKDGTSAAKVPANWWAWPLVMLPAALVGLALALRLWNAKAAPCERSRKPDAAPIPKMDRALDRLGSV